MSEPAEQKKPSFRDRLKRARLSPEYWTEKAILGFTLALQSALSEKNMTQAALAREAGIAPGMVSRVLAGQDNVTIRTIVRFAHALGYRVDIKISPIASRIAEPLSSMNESILVNAPVPPAPKGAALDVSRTTELNIPTQTYSQSYKKAA